MEKIGSVEQTLKIINENDFYIKKSLVKILLLTKMF